MDFDQISLRYSPVEQARKPRPMYVLFYSGDLGFCPSFFGWFFSRPLPKAGRELQTELDTMSDGPLVKNQPEASLRAVSQL